MAENAQGACAAHVASDERVPLFGGMSCDYLIDKGAMPGRLLSDLRCLLGAGVAVMDECSERFSEAEYGGLFLLRQALGITDLLASMVPDERAGGVQ